jgi:transcriptional regulator with XRE-family HTH domain
MNEIFRKIAGMVESKTVKQKEVAERLGITSSHISGVLSGACEPSKTLTMLAEIIYGERKTEHPNPRIEAILKIAEGLEPDTLKSALDSIEKEKLFEEVKKERQGKIAA